MSFGKESGMNKQLLLVGAAACGLAVVSFGMGYYAGYAKDKSVGDVQDKNEDSSNLSESQAQPKSQVEKTDTSCLRQTVMLNISCVICCVVCILVTVICLIWTVINA